MNRLISLILVAVLGFSAMPCYAKGGFSGGGGRGGFSSGRSSFSSGRSYSSPSRSASMPSRSTTTTTTRTSTSRGGYSGGGYYGGMGYHPMMYPGFGMGYGYSNGILTGLIIGNMMHPQGTTVYSGGGYSGGSALLYPDGRVVDQNGYQVGTYQNGQFTAQAGGMVAQPAPADAQQTMQQQAQPVNIVEAGPSGWEIAGGIIIGVLVLIIIFAAIA